MVRPLIDSPYVRIAQTENRPHKSRKYNDMHGRMFLKLGDAWV